MKRSRSSNEGRRIGSDPDRGGVIDRSSGKTIDDVRRMLDQRYDDFKSGRVKELTLDELREDIERRKREFLQQRHEP